MNKEAIKILKQIIPKEYTELIEKNTEKSLERAEQIAHMAIIDLFRGCKKNNDRLH